MQNFITYTNSKKLEDKIKARHLIPYRITPHSRYSCGKYYYSEYWDEIFKVEQVSYKHGILEEAYIKWENDRMGLICTEPAIGDYLVLKDKESLYQLDDIVNTGRTYKGAEIIYWFFINDIGRFTKKYQGFWKYVEPYNKYRIIDDKDYYITAETGKSGNYIKCRIVEKL